MSTNTELIARSQRVASELDDHNANMDRRARTCIRELVAALESMEQAITDPENQPSQFGTVLLATHQALQAEVERLTTLAHGQHIELYNARLQLAAAQGQEPVGFVESAVRGAGGFHACFSSGVFIPAGTQLFAAPIPQQPASLLALLTTRSILIWLYEKLGGVIESSTPISREIEPWPRVSITEDSLCDLRKIWESLPKMQEDLMRHVEAAHNQRSRNGTD